MLSGVPRDAIAASRLTLAGVGLACCLLAAGCGSARSAGSTGGAAPTPHPPTAHATTPQPTTPHPTTPHPTRSARASATASAPAPGAAGRVTKILVIMEENHSIGQVFPARMPYLWSLARRFGMATSWSDVGHPSLPNYLAIFAGSSFNNPQDCSPGPGCTYPGPSVFGQVIANGGTARAYQESMPSPCDRATSGNYDVNHNPWAYFPGEAGDCLADDIAAGTPAAGRLASDARTGTLPTVGMITPNLIHDAHDGTLAQADAWLRSWLPVLMSGPDWRAGRLAIVVVFDEGETTEQVPFVIMAPGVSGDVISRPLDHYALTRLMDEVAGVQPLRAAARAPSLGPALRLKL